MSLHVSNMTTDVPLTSGNPQPLSFPPSQFAKLAPRSYLHAHLSSSSGHRPSGRLPSESRKPTVNTGSLTHCHGSAVIRSGDTAVVCGIRGEILNASDIVDYKPAIKPQELHQRYGGTSIRFDASLSEKKQVASFEDAEELAQLNLLVPNVELSTGCSPSYLPGAPPSTEAQSLSHRVLTLLHTSQLPSMDNHRIWYHPSPSETDSTAPPTEAMHSDPTSMSLDVPNEPPSEGAEADTPQPEVKAYWTLHITLLVLSLSGSPFPTLWGALLAALRNTRLPQAWWDADAQSVLCSPLISDAQPLRLNRQPIAANFGVFSIEKDGTGLVSSIHGQDQGKQTKKWILADPDGFEESCCEEEVTVVVRAGQKRGMEIVKIEKAGGGAIGRKEMREVVALAEKRWTEWKTVLENEA